MTAIAHKTDGQTERRRLIDGVLRALLRIQESETQNPSLREKLLSLEGKLASNQLYLAVLGQMKRGKSSFINALLGAEILPTGVLPVTAIITEIKYGPIPEAAILYSNGRRETVDPHTLSDYITESGNPGNKKQVASVDLAYPSHFLASGIILVDTPGIGSTHAHNTRTTEAYLEQADAGIVVLSVDPPITEVESQFIRNLREEIPKLFFILNKIDAASSEEVSHISGFLEDELRRLRVVSPEIFCLSARKAVEKRCHAPADPDSSGIEAFEHRLRTFLAVEKSQVLVHSIAMDALHAARTLKFGATIGVRARSMSPEDLDHKRLALDRLLEQTESEMRELQMLLHQHSGEIVANVERDLNAHVREFVPVLRQRLREFQSQHPRETGRAFGTLLEIFFMQQVESVFRNWRVQEDEKIQTQLDVLSARFVARANAVLQCLQRAAGALFEMPVEHLSISCPLRVESRLYYRVERVFHSLDSFLLALPRFLLRPIVLRNMNTRMWQLLDMNAGRIRHDYVERLQLSMTRFDKDLNAAVTILTESLRSALRKPGDNLKRGTDVLEELDGIVRTCSELML
jgi:ribosome biogenesis GTPase A